MTNGTQWNKLYGHLEKLKRANKAECVWEGMREKQVPCLQVSVHTEENELSRKMLKAFNAKLPMKQTATQSLSLPLKFLSETEGSHIKLPN